MSDVKQIKVERAGPMTVIVHLQCHDAAKAARLHQTLTADLAEFDVLRLDIVLPSGTYKRGTP